MMSTEGCGILSIPMSIPCKARRWGYSKVLSVWIEAGLALKTIQLMFALAQCRSRAIALAALIRIRERKQESLISVYGAGGYECSPNV